jgi:ribosomal-protein-alanine N-acetyltransferase
MRQAIMTSHPEKMTTLSTNRLILQPLTEVHRQDLFRLFSTEEVTRLMGIATMKEESEVESWLEQYKAEQIQQHHMEWAIILRDSKEFAGRCGFANINWKHKRAEISCALIKEFWGKKIGEEALKSMLQYAFSELGLNRIEAQLWPDNARMVRLLEKLGFNREGILKGHYYYNEKFGDTVVYGLLNPASKPAVSPLANPTPGR